MARNYSYDPGFGSLINNTAVKLSYGMKKEAKRRGGNEKRTCIIEIFIYCAICSDFDPQLKFEFHTSFTITVNLKNASSITSASSSISIDSLDVSVTAGNQVLFANAQIGVLNARVVNGKALATVAVNANWVCLIALSFYSNFIVFFIYLLLLKGNGSSLMASGTGTLDVVLPFEATLAGVGLHNYGSGKPTVFVQSSNIFTNINLTTINMDRFYDFSDFGPQQLLAMLASFSAFLGQCPFTIFLNIINIILIM